MSPEILPSMLSIKGRVLVYFGMKILRLFSLIVYLYCDGTDVEMLGSDWMSLSDLLPDWLNLLL